MKASHRIVFNTGVLYAKLLIVMAIGLISVRLVLSALGETDYGIYSLVAGVVGMLALLQSAMSNASMRFMAHSLGSGDDQLISKVFNTTLFLHFVIGLIVVVLIEAGGWIMFEYFLDIPADRLSDAKIVFHFMVVTSFVTIIAVPYDAVMNSHENLLAISIVDVLGAVLKLGLAIYLTYGESNLLVIYGFCMLLIQVIKRAVKQRYSVVKYKECKVNFKKYVGKSIAKEILSFSTWNLFGSLAAISVTQVRSVLLNMFFGVNINAANGIALQVTSQVNTVSASMSRALNPQLMKSEGGGDRSRMLRLTELATKYSVFLFAFFAIPVIIEMPYLLDLWLEEVPEFAVIFSRLILIGLLISKFSFEITSAIRAVGKIRNFQVTETIIIVLNIPLAYFIFKLGYPSYSIFIVSIIISLFVFVERLYFGHRVAKMEIFKFFKNAIFPILIPVIFSSFVAVIPLFLMEESFGRFVITFLISTALLLVLFRYTGLADSELKQFKIIIYGIFDRIKRIKK